MSPRNRNENDWAAQSLIGVLASAFGGSGRVRTRHTADGLIHLSGDYARAIVADTVARPSRPALLEAWHGLVAHARDLDAVPVLVLPHVPRSLCGLIADEQINWVDRAGNASVVAPPLVIHVEGRGVARRRVAGVDPFAARSTNIVRLLLVDPKRRWRQKELVAATGLSQPRTSKVISALRLMGLLELADDGNIHLADPGGLLDMWGDAHSYRRWEIAPAHLSGDGIQLAHTLAERLEEADVTHWFTGLPAAWAYDQFARFRLVSVFVDADPEIVRRDLDLRSPEHGANIHLVAGGGQKLELGQAFRQGIRCVHPAQAYVDLLDLPERASEAAEHLRSLALAGPPS